MVFADLLDRLLEVPEDCRARALDRIRRATPVEEDGFTFFSLPHDEEERYSFIKRPVALQFHHYNKLYKVTGERTAGVFELFLDLLYVAIIALFSSTVAEAPDTLHVLKYVIIFLHAYQIWQDLREIFNSYYTDDILQRLLILVIMGFMVIFANNAVNIGDKDGPDETSFYTAVAAFQLAHLILIANWLFYSLFIAEHLIRMRLMGIANTVSFIIRMGLLFVGWRGRVTLAILALAVERGCWFYIYSPMFRSHVDSEFSTAVNIEHESDRMTALYIIVLGEFLNAVVLGAPAGDGLSSKTLRAMLVLIIAFSLTWLYRHSDGSFRNTHALRRSATSAMLWFWIHEPLCAVLVLSGDIAAEFTKESHINHRALQWMFCGCIAIGIFCLWALAQCTLARDTLLLPKQSRMALRIVDIVLFAFLPLTEWSTTTILEIVSGMLLITVGWETFGSLVCEEDSSEESTGASSDATEADPLLHGESRYSSVETAH